MQKAIENKYKINFVLDNLPGIYKFDNQTIIGYPIGFIEVFLKLSGWSLLYK